MKLESLEVREPRRDIGTVSGAVGVIGRYPCGSEATDLPWCWRQLTEARCRRAGASAGPAATLTPSPPPDTGPPADERSQTKKSIGRQPPPALAPSRAGRRAVARHRTAIPHRKPTEASTAE